MWSLYEIQRSLRKHLISNACILLSMSAGMVHVSHACKNMDIARECISLILELMVLFLSFLMTFSLVTAAVVSAIPESTSGLDPSSDTIAPRHLKLRTVSSFLLSMVMSLLMPLVLFVFNWVISALICMPYVVDSAGSSLDWSACRMLWRPLQGDLPTWPALALVQLGRKCHQQNGSYDIKYHLFIEGLVDALSEVGLMFVILIARRSTTSFFSDKKRHRKKRSN